MVALEAVAWPEVRLVSIEQTTVRVVIGQDVHLFSYETRDEMEQDLQRWFLRASPDKMQFAHQGRLEVV